jgi:hypothetical protein
MESRATAPREAAPYSSQLKRNNTTGQSYNQGKEVLHFAERKAKSVALNRHNNVKDQQSCGHPAGSTVDFAASAPADA